MMNISEPMLLANGVELPRVGLGTWQTPEGDAVETSVAAALAAGYRHLDTAAIYRNEVGVGKALAASGVARDEVFVTTKIWNSERGFDKVMPAIQASLERLGLDYVDLYLVHWPANPKQFGADWARLNSETWRGMEYVLEAGLTRSIGVSNFYEHHLDALLATAKVVPMVNQVKVHPGLLPTGLLTKAAKLNMVIEAYSPLGTGKVLADETLASIGVKHGVSAAQVALRWGLQQDLVILPKSVTPDRIVQNADLFGFSLDDADMAAIYSLPKVAGPNPDQIDF